MLTIHQEAEPVAGTTRTGRLIGAAALTLTLGSLAIAPTPATADTASCTVSAPEAELSDEQAAALYTCLTEALEAQLATLDAGGEIEGPSWLLSDRPEARAFLSWASVTRAPYPSATHGGRYVVNLAGPDAMPSYSRFEAGGPMPVGGSLAKPSFTVSNDGTAQLGPLFLMEKAEEGAYPEMGDWIYSAIMPNGSTMGRTGGPGNDAVQFCADCHLGIGAETDRMTYLPEEYRIAN